MQDFTYIFLCSHWHNLVFHGAKFSSSWCLYFSYTNLDVIRKFDENIDFAFYAIKIVPILLIWEFSYQQYTEGKIIIINEKYHI